MRKIVLISMMAVALALPLPVLACRTGPTISDFERFDQWLRNQSEVEGTIVFRNSETADDPDDPDYQATVVHATITSANDGKVEVTLFNPGLITVSCGVRAIIPADGASGFFYVSELGQVVHWSEQRLPPPVAFDFGPASSIEPMSADIPTLDENGSH